MTQTTISANAAGRVLPDSVAGYGDVVPFAGAFATAARPGSGAIANRGFVSPGSSKLMPDLRAALEAAGLTDGMTVSFHHHLREGDAVVNQTMQTIAEMGVGDITIAPTILFNVHEPLVELVRRGMVRTIHGCMTGPIGRLASEGGLAAPAVLRSHGGRARAIAAGDLKIDIAVIAAPTADPQGNCNGVTGPSACGPLSFSHADAMYADKVIVVTDNLVDYPATPISIGQQHVDFVVAVPSIGDPGRIVAGITQKAIAGPRLSIARAAADVVWHAGIVREGFNFQSGAGGTSLATTEYLGQIMRRENIRAAWVNGGINECVLKLLRDGYVGKVLNCQAFDEAAVRSLHDDPAHVEISMDQYANPHNKGCVCHQLDAVFLGATEIDVDFNVNVNTHSDGYLLHAIGGHQDTAAGAKLTIVTAPVARKTHPIIVDRVTTITTPGEVVDVIVTDAGVAVNPRSWDGELLERLNHSPLRVVPIETLRNAARAKAGQDYQAGLRL
jgi:citrate lyase subunit alpha/citrate CoA-transferase